MVGQGADCQVGRPGLSVLALSSRFDGREDRRRAERDPQLSVLALSSRFDGLGHCAPALRPNRHFQYSLCRVVLMVFVLVSYPVKIERLSVLALSSRFDGLRLDVRPQCLKPFQYSLCRVVLMVEGMHKITIGQTLFQYSLCRVVLMVWSLIAVRIALPELSVLALSSRFDGQGRWLTWPTTKWIFQYSLCRVVLMVTFVSLYHPTHGVAFSTRSVESF